MVAAAEAVHRVCWRHLTREALCCRPCCSRGFTGRRRQQSRDRSRLHRVVARGDDCAVGHRGAGAKRLASGRVGRGHRDGAGALPRRRRLRSGRHRATARPINFRVLLPASWNRRAAQLGGGGINGVIPNLTGVEFGSAGPSLLQRGFATYGSDSGHQLPAFGPRRGGPPAAPPSAPPDQDWALNDEVIRNFGYAQMKKTHDAAMVLISACTASGRASTTTSAPRRAGAKASRWRSAIPPTTTASPPTCRS